MYEQLPSGKFKAPCLKCGGTGEIPRYYHNFKGVCFSCLGHGYVELSKPRRAVSSKKVFSVGIHIKDGQIGREWVDVKHLAEAIDRWLGYTEHNWNKGKPWKLTVLDTTDQQNTQTYHLEGGL